MKKKNIILTVVLILVAVVLLNPQWIPFLDAGTKSAIQAQLQATFGDLVSGEGFLTAGKVITAIVAAIGIFLICMLICFVLNLIAKYNKNAQSMAGLFSSLTKFIGAIAGIVVVLGILGVNLAGIFASLGILSLIIGFGAQSLIEDAVTGIFIIFEGQYKVGDIIVLDEFRGTVKSIGIRTTALEDTGGNYKIVNNSDIRNMQNRSRNSSVAVCDIGISYSARIEDVEKVIAAGLPEIYNKHKDLFLSVPRYAGVESLGESCVVMRVIADITEENYFIGYRTLNREMKILFDDHNIEIPFNQLVLYNGDK